MRRESKLLGGRLELEVLADHDATARGSAAAAARLLVNHRAVAAPIVIPQLGDRLAKVDANAPIVNQRLHARGCNSRGNENQYDRTNTTVDGKNPLAMIRTLSILK